ncbi:12533_t:CDS:1, partial [Racocetra persica]
MDESKTQSNIIIQGLAMEKNNNEVLESSSQYNEKAEIHEIYIPESSESQNNTPDTNQDEVRSMKNFYVISSGYLLFTLTDSGLRMIVLFELFNEHYG